MATSATTPEVEVDPWELVDDGSKVEDREAYAATLEEYRAADKEGIAAARGATRRYKRAAALNVQLRSMITAKNGRPDWAASSAVYRETVKRLEDQLFSTVDTAEKRTVQGAIRQHVSRNFLEPAITEYVLRTGDHGVKQGDLKWTEAKNEVPAVVASFDEKNPAQMALRKAIAEEYREARIDVPVKFGGTKKGGTGGGTDGDSKENPAADLSAALSALDAVAPLTAAQDLHRAISAYSERVRSGGEISDRPEVEKTLVAISVVSHMTAKWLGGKSTEKDLEALTGAMFAPAAK